MSTRLQSVSVNFEACRRKIVEHLSECVITGA